LLTTGTPAFFDGPQGVQRLEPLAQRLHVDFQTDPRFDNPRAVQLRLASFDHDRLVEVGIKVRDLFVTDCSSPARVLRLADNAYIDTLARSVTGKLGGKVGIAPRSFLKKLVSDVLDRIDQFDDFDPRQALPVDRQYWRDDESRTRSAGRDRRRHRVGRMSEFERLHPALQHHIVNSLGWNDLRPVQALSITAYLGGANLVVLAPTAGGRRRPRSSRCCRRC
jgi:hypothetical protein